MDANIQVLKHRNRKRNRKTVNNKKINDNDLYYFISDLVPPKSSIS